MSKLTEVININNPADFIPTKEDAERIISAKYLYEKYGKDQKWTEKNFIKCPWGIAWLVSPKGRSKSLEKAMRYLVLAIVLKWQELIDQLRRTTSNFGITTEELNYVKTNIWEQYYNDIADSIKDAYNSANLQAVLKENITEDIEKHDILNPKLFTENNILRNEVREKLLEIVDEFIDDLASDEVEFNIEDIILIGSNVSYNYTKDSDLDIHIIAKTNSLKCPKNIVNALYSAYRSLFNKKFDIEFYGIPVELYVETEDSARVSNGIYSVKTNKWIKEPEMSDIPELDREAFDKLYKEWETKCKILIADIKADKLKDEVKITEIIEDIYELRRSGISEGEYSIQNLVFKELRNNKFLDDLKEYRNKLIAKRLSLEEALKEENTFKQDFPNIN